MRKGAVFAGRKSGRAKEIGDKAERIVFDWLRSQAQDDRGRTKIHWVASEGKTPGWDIEDRRSAKLLLVYEVKGTSGSQFPAIEVTANEWVAAEAHGVRYHLVFVSNCESATPRIAVVKNPWQLLHDGYCSATPIGFRLERVRAWS